MNGKSMLNKTRSGTYKERNVLQDTDVTGNLT